MSSSAQHRTEADLAGNAAGVTRRDLLALAAMGVVAGASRQVTAATEGQLTYGVHVSLAPSWFDPAETQGIITPYMVLYALHDSMVKATISRSARTRNSITASRSPPRTLNSPTNAIAAPRTS